MGTMGKDRKGITLKGGAMTEKKKPKQSKEEIKAAYAKLTEQIQSLCPHRRMGVCSEEGHNFVYCQDCNKPFYGMDI